MKTFLEIVAEDIIRKYGNNLSRIAVVFPNKRASLFLNEALARLSGKPIWSPAYITISDLFRQHSSLTVGDPIRLVCELYRTFISVTGIDETLDHFYGWGQLLISDFDDIDKNMAVAHDVFRNLRDIHELDDLSYLTEEQTKLLQRFFSNFSPDHNSELKQRFLKLWTRFEDIYTQYRQQLRDEQLAYEGMLYREVAEQEDITLKYDTYLFVGFNMMQKVEVSLCERLQKAQRAKFYWDFDTYYMAPHHEAGHYIREYLKRFPNELDDSNQEIYSCFSGKKDISFVSSQTENAQARFVTQWLRQKGRIEAGKKTAIVLCDEHHRLSAQRHAREFARLPALTTETNAENAQIPDAPRDAPLLCPFLRGGYAARAHRRQPAIHRVDAEYRQTHRPTHAGRGQPDAGRGAFPHVHPAEPPLLAHR